MGPGRQAGVCARRTHPDHGPASSAHELNGRAMLDEAGAQAEFDAVLTDGAIAHIRPIRPDDADGLVAFHARLSPESQRLRFFTPHPRLSAAEVRRFTQVDHSDREAL